MTAYTSRDVAGLFGLTPARVRSLARAGILSPSRGPRREYRFGFQDLVLLRSARSLLDARVPQRRVSRTLRRLVRQLPAGRRPSEIHLSTDGDRIVAHDGEATWLPDNGQVLFDFSGAARPAPITPITPVNLGEALADDWCRHGLDLEAAGRIDDAIAALRLAIQASPAMADAHYHLARLYQGSGRKLAAMVHLKRYQECSTEGRVDG